ncbi:MAG: hypothetical protein M1823_006197 [Watsoniomyces obsoletus]|nr:MAG: hypothetical protein M1823_006197 [Watsoniomyces obsoletus]
MAMSDVPAVYISEEVVDKPEGDKRDYPLMKLPNDVEALVIHDPETDIARVALDVDVGDMDSQPDVQGSAHALEHILFQGTQQPRSAEVVGSSFRSVFDRWADRFIDPVFHEPDVAAEFKTIQSEFESNILRSNARINRLGQSTANPDHPFSYLTGGNLETLQGHHQEIFELYRKGYAPHRMKLVVLARESLDERQSWVVTVFHRVPNRIGIERSWLQQPFLRPSQLCQQHFALSPTGTHIVHVLSKLIGHEGKGGMRALLRRKLWATKAFAREAVVIKGKALFRIEVVLTSDGSNNYKEIVGMVFQYLAFLHKHSQPLTYFAEEVKEMNEVEFRFGGKIPSAKLAMDTSRNLQIPIPRKTLLRGLYQGATFEPDDFRNALAQLHLDNFRLMLSGPDVSSNCTLSERWYQIEYQSSPISPSNLKQFRGTSRHQFHLPLQNPYIPRSFVTHPRAQPPKVEPSLQWEQYTWSSGTHSSAQPLEPLWQVKSFANW